MPKTEEEVKLEIEEFLSEAAIDAKEKADKLIIKTVEESKIAAETLCEENSNDKIDEAMKKAKDEIL